MTATDILIVLALAGVIFATQLGRRRFSWRRALVPVGILAWVTNSNLHGLPTSGGDVILLAAAAAVGIALGLLSVAFVRIEREPSGERYTVAGLGYAAVWAVALGGRLLLGYGMEHWFGAPVVRFGLAHQLTLDVWGPAFLMVSIGMVAARTVAVVARVATAEAPPAAVPVAA